MTASCSAAGQRQLMPSDAARLTLMAPAMYRRDKTDYGVKRRGSETATNDATYLILVHFTMVVSMTV